jgi:hypothetical protein
MTFDLVASTALLSIDGSTARRGMARVCRPGGLVR